MGQRHRKKKNINGGEPRGDGYRRGRWGSGDDSSVRTRGSGKLRGRGEKHGSSAESMAEVSRGYNVRYSEYLEEARAGISIKYQNIKRIAYDTHPCGSAAYVEHVILDASRVLSE